jgi:hypothetical protein
MSQAMVRFNCPQCNAVFSTPVSLAGKSLTCKKCGMKLTVPTAGQSAAPAKPPMTQPQPQPQPISQPALSSLSEPSYQPLQPAYQPAPQPQYQAPVATPPSQPGGMSGPTKFCHACGQRIDARAEICPGCGVRQPGMSSPAVVINGLGGSGGAKNRMVAVMLALFLGGLGAHHFYLGRPILGIVYLLSCWTLIPALVAFIEALVMLCTSDEAFQRQFPS